MLTRTTCGYTFQFVVKVCLWLYFYSGGVDLVGLCCHGLFVLMVLFRCSWLCGTLLLRFVCAYGFVQVYLSLWSYGF